jgi:hypothetical protein
VQSWGFLFLSIGDDFAFFARKFERLFGAQQH